MSAPQTPRWAPDMGIDEQVARWWRRGLGAILAAEALALVVQTTWKAGQAPIEAGDSPVFAALAGSWPALSGLALVAWLALWRFVRRAASWLPLLVALVSLGVLVEANGLVFHDYNRNYFFPGAMAGAWLAGLLFARAVGVTRREAAERLAGAGAVAMLGMAYFNAGVSKLLYSGGEWLNPAVIRLTLVMENPVDDTGFMAAIWRAVVEEPDLAAELAILAVVMELCGVFFVFGWRGRALAGSVMLVLHAGMLSFLHIVFVDAVACLLFFSYPWHRWLGRAQTPRVSASAEPVSTPRVHRAAAAVLAVALAVWLVPGSPARTGSVHASAEAARGQVALESFGPLTVGDRLAADWRLAELTLEGAVLAIVVTRGEGERVTLFAGGPSGPVQPGPFAAWPARLAHGPLTVPWAAFEPAGQDVASRLSGALAGDTALMETWLSGAAPGGER